MPEIARISSELAVGKFDDRLMATRLDTLERNNSLFGDFNIPEITYVPKGLSTDGILSSEKVPPISDYLNSPDPKLRNMGKDYLEADARKNISLTKGIGLPDMVKYQEGQEKFTNNHWWSESGKTKFGYNPDKSLAENENLYYEQVWNNYSLAGKAWRGAGTTALRILSKLTTGLIGTVGDIGSMAWNGLEEIAEAAGGPKNNSWADISDNVLARAMHNVDDYVKNEIVPTYKAINYDDKGAFSKLTDPYFWQNEMADGAGFLLQFAIPATLLGKATKLAKAATLTEDATTLQKILATGVGESATAGRFAKATGKALETLTGSRNVGGISAHLFNTTMESVAETKDGFDATVKNLLSKGYSEEEAKRIASEHAPTQFGLNMFILSLSNAMENKWFQQSIGNRAFRREAVTAAGEIAERKATTKFGKFFTDNTVGKRLSFYVPKAGAAMVMEGFWEENAQQAATRVAAGEYMRRGDDTLSEGEFTKSKSFFKQLIKQTFDASWWGKGDKEVADSIMAGAVLGVLGGTGFAKLAGDSRKGKILPLGERKTIEKNKADLVASVKNARAAWMDVSVMPEDLYNEDGTLNDSKVEERVSQINAKLGKIQSMFTRKIEADDITDPVRRQQLQHTLFADFIRGHIIHGTGEELIRKLNNWNTKTPGELAAYGVTEEMIDDPKMWGGIAQKLYDEYHKIEGLKFHNPDKLPIESYMNQVSAIRAHIFDYTALKMAAETATSQYAEREAEFDPFLKTPSIFNTYNAIVAKAEWYRQASETPNLNPEVKKHLEDEHKLLMAEIDSLKEGLPEHDTSSTSDFAFEKGIDVKKRETEILQTLPQYLEFQWLKENTKKEAEHYDGIIKEYSDPDKGLPKWTEQVKKWDDILSRVKLQKLKDFGYTEAEIVKMTPEEQDEILTNSKKKEPTEEVKEEEVKLEEKIEKKEEGEPTLEEVTNQLVDTLKSLDPNVTSDNLDKALEKFLIHVQNNPEIEMPIELTKLIMSYNKLKVDTVKSAATGQFKEEAKQDLATELDEEEKELTPEEDDTELAALKPPAVPPASPVKPPEEEPGMVPPALLDEVRHAYRLHQQALENETSFKEEAEKENLVIHNNRIDNNSDNGKNEGTINIVTSNPKDIEKGAIRISDNNIARFNFLDQLSSRKLKREDYKLVLGIGKQGGIYGIVSDKDGNFVKFDESGKPFKEGSNLLFHLDGFDLYSEENIGKRRSEIVAPPFSIAPLTATPIILHPSFTGVNVLEVLKERIKNGTVTASINFVTQGMLFRQGVNNGYTIPKGTNIKTASELYTKGHLKNEKGNIPSESTVIDGIYHRAMRIHFDLLKDVNNPSSPTETVEFHPVSIAEAKTEKGEKILDILKAENGENIIEAAVKGNLPATAENMLTLQTILRPDKFYVLNLGTVIQVVDLKKFRKFLVSGHVTHAELMKITKLEDVYNSELNISKAYYDSRDSLPLQKGLLSEGSENYSRFINGNVATSAETIKIGNIEGYARVNKRMTLIVDENMEDLKKAQSRKNQEKESPTSTVVEIEPLSDEDILKEFNNPNPDIDFGDIAKDNC